MVCICAKWRCDPEPGSPRKVKLYRGDPPHAVLLLFLLRDTGSGRAKQHLLSLPVPLLL